MLRLRRLDLLKRLLDVQFHLIDLLKDLIQVFGPAHRLNLVDDLVSLLLQLLLLSINFRRSECRLLLLNFLQNLLRPHLNLILNNLFHRLLHLVIIKFLISEAFLEQVKFLLLLQQLRAELVRFGIVTRHLARLGRVLSVSVQLKLLVLDLSFLRGQLHL